MYYCFFDIDFPVHLSVAYGKRKVTTAQKEPYRDRCGGECMPSTWETKAGITNPDQPELHSEILS
jgi:hypothetical protein